MDLNSYEMTGLRVSLDLINRLVPGAAQGVAYDADLSIDAVRRVLKDDHPNAAPIEEGHVVEFAALAERMRALVGLLADGRIDDAAPALNRMLRDTPAAPELDQDEDGTWRMHHHPLDAALVPMWSAICAEGLAREVSNQNAHRFGKCDAKICDRVFFDTSRNAKRRYCSLACQNRAKAAAFRERHGT